MSSTADTRLIWIDLEMTGLDTDNDQIIEVATIVTDDNLNILAEGPVLAVHQPDRRCGPGGRGSVCHGLGHEPALAAGGPVGGQPAAAHRAVDDRRQGGVRGADAGHGAVGGAPRLAICADALAGSAGGCVETPERAAL